MPHAYPMMLDVADRLVVIVGGGSVAARKAAGLIECGATRVRCVAPDFAPAMPAEVQRLRAAFATNHLDGAGLAFAATNDPAVNAAVVREARARGILVNRADADDDDAPGDFVTPARLRESAVTVTVSAGSPALAVLIRDGIARHWDPRWSRMAEAMGALRPLIVARRDLGERRRQMMFRQLATPEALDVLAGAAPDGVGGGVEALRAWLAARFPEIADQTSHG